MPAESNLAASLAASGLGFGEPQVSGSTLSDLVAVGAGKATVLLLSTDGVVVSPHSDLVAVGAVKATVLLLSTDDVVVSAPSDLADLGFGEATVSLSTSGGMVVSGRLGEATRSFLSGTGTVVATPSDPVATLLLGTDWAGGG